MKRILSKAPPHADTNKSVELMKKAVMTCTEADVCRIVQYGEKHQSSSTSLIESTKDPSLQRRFTNSVDAGTDTCFVENEVAATRPTAFKSR